MGDEGMGEPRHVNGYNEMSSYVLAKLYEVYPGDVQFDIEAFLEEDHHLRDREDLFEDTIKVLIEDGYVSIAQKLFLTLKKPAFEVLKKPNPIFPKETMGEILIKWGKSTVLGAVKDQSAKLASGAAESLAALAQSALNSSSTQ